MDCNSPNLVWHTCNYTVYESYPPQGSAECIQYSGCMYEGQFAYCSQTETQSWVASHNVVSIYTLADNGAGPYANHKICMKYGGQSIVADVLDTCGNSDCGGCCTQNSQGAEGICDTELGTDGRFLMQGLNGGQNGVQFADLGADPTACTTGVQ
jgi:hypothetical protein